MLYGIVIYDYMAHNNKELTIHAGEKVEVSFFFQNCLYVYAAVCYLPGTLNLFNLSISQASTSLNLEDFSISNISLSKTFLYVEQFYISNIPLSQDF